MSKCAVRVKMELRFDPEHKPISRVEKHLKKMLNHPKETVSSVRIAPGYSACAVFLTLTDSKHSIDSLETAVEVWLDGYYAENLKVLYSRVEAVSVEKQVVEQ